MKTKIYTILMLLTLMQSAWKVKSEEIVGYSGLFTFNTKGDFTALPVSTSVLHPIQFTSIATGIGQPVSWVWNFGDFSTGMDRFQPNPIHSYTKSGSFNINLTITII